MVKLNHALSLLLSATLTLQAFGTSAFAAVQCPVVHNQVRMGALHELSQDQRTTLKTTLWQRLFNGKALKEFSVQKYKETLGSLLAGDKRPTDSETWQSTEGKLAVIEFLNITSRNALKLDDVLTRLENLKALKQRELMRMVSNRLTANNFLSAEYLDDWSADFFLLLRGANVRMIDYVPFVMSAEARAKKQLGGLFQEELLTYGLKGVMTEMGVPEATTKDRFVVIANKVLAVGLKALEIATLRLPARKPVQMSEQLMEKVMLDGADAHKEAIDKELAPQIGKNRYQAVRKVLGPVMAASFAVYFYTGEGKITIEQQANEQATQMIDQQHSQDRMAVSSSLATVENLVQQMSAQKDAERFFMTVDYYRSKHEGKNPSPSEMRHLLTKIYGQKLSTHQIDELVKSFFQSQPVPTVANQLISKQSKG